MHLPRDSDVFESSDQFLIVAVFEVTASMVLATVLRTHPSAIEGREEVEIPHAEWASWERALDLRLCLRGGSVL